MTFTKKARIANLKDGDSYHDYVKITHSPSKEEEKRFDLYVFPVVIFNVGTYIWKCLCRYLAGLFEANLIEDHLIILWLHLWGTSKVNFVYEYDDDGMFTMLHVVECCNRFMYSVQCMHFMKSSKS